MFLRSRCLLDCLELYLARLPIASSPLAEMGLETSFYTPYPRLSCIAEMKAFLKRDRRAA